MKVKQFKSSLQDPSPPTGLNPLLAALWYDAKGDWDKAHETAQNIMSDNGSWIHAYLHRKEGDLPNASYWYSYSGRKMPSCTPKEEWESILAELIDLE